MREKLKSLVKKDFAKSIIVFVVLVLVAFVSLKYFDIELLRSWVNSWGFWGMLVYIIAKSLALIVAPINGTPIYILGSVAYGPFLGFILSFIGDMLGAVVSFYLARKYGRVWVDKLFSVKEEGMIGRLLKIFTTARGVFYGHIFFVTFPDILNYAAGLSQVKFKTYMKVHAPFTAAVIIVVSYGSSLVFLLGPSGIAIISVLGLLAIGAGIWLMNWYSKKAGISEEVVEEDINK